MFSGSKYKPVERFSGLAEVYARSRPGYPEAALSFILRDLKPEARIADIGSGTGILTRALAARRWRVTGVEPNLEMLGAAEQTACLADPQPTYIAGNAEATGLPNGSIDLVVAAQAFHWFDAEAALGEFHRVLAPGGRVALVWNDADETDELTAAFWGTLRELATDPEVVRDPHHFTGRILLGHRLFIAGGQAVFPNLQQTDELGLIDRACSASFAPRSGSRRDELIARMRSLFARHERAGEVTLHYQTVVYKATRSEAVGRS